MDISYALDLFKNSKLIQIAAVLLIAFIFDRLLVSKTIHRLLKKSILKNARMEAKFETVFSIMRTFFVVIIYFSAGLLIFQIIFETSASSIIAATGVIGVIAGLGAQSVVKDAFSGFFILLENQYAVGDLVSVDSFMGFVESVTIRTTIIKSFEGDRLIIPNGNLSKIINHSRRDKSIFTKVNISYKEDVNRAIKVLDDICKLATDEMEEITDGVEVLGVGELNPFSVTLMLLVHCRIDAQFRVQRELLRRIRIGFSNNGIKMPFCDTED